MAGMIPRPTPVAYNEAVRPHVDNGSSRGLFSEAAKPFAHTDAIRYIERLLAQPA